MTQPGTPGSTSDARIVIVWFGVRQRKLSETEQLALSTKKRWTKALAPLSVLVMLIRVFSTAGFVRLEVYMGKISTEPALSSLMGEGTGKGSGTTVRVATAGAALLPLLVCRAPAGSVLRSL